MKILHTETLKRWGGQQSRVLQEAVGLSRRGHGVVLACNKGSILSQRARREGIKTYELSLAKWSYPFTVPQLIAIIRKEKIDVVCTNSSIDSWAGGIASLLAGRRLVRIKHNMYRIKKDPPTRFIYSLPERFIAVSDSASEAIMDAGYIDMEKVRKVYGGIDTAQFDPEQVTDREKTDLRLNLGIPEDSLIIGNTSGFTGIKGQPHLLSAANEIFRERDDVYLLLAGRYSAREKVLEPVSPEFHHRVILPGLRRDIPQILSMIHVFVFPSTVEAFGYSLIEAMAMMKPVVVSDIPSFRSYLQDGVNGVFFKSGDAGDLLSVLKEVIGNPQEWERLGSRARMTVLQRFQAERLFDEIEIIYGELLENKKAHVS